jgi:hypothetical protein
MEISMLRKSSISSRRSMMTVAKEEIFSTKVMEVIREVSRRILSVFSRRLIDLIKSKKREEK